MKKFTTQFNIGKVKYVISFHDGIQKHDDGSEFWGVYTFRNKKLFNARIKELKKQGYVEN